MVNVVPHTSGKIPQSQLVHDPTQGGLFPTCVVFHPHPCLYHLENHGCERMGTACGRCNCCEDEDHVELTWMHVTPNSDEWLFVLMVDGVDHLVQIPMTVHLPVHIPIGEVVEDQAKSEVNDKIQQRWS